MFSLIGSLGMKKYLSKHYKFLLQFRRQFQIRTFTSQQPPSIHQRFLCSLTQLKQLSTNEILDNISSVIAHDTSVLKKKDQLASGIIQSLEECASRGNIDALKILGNFYAMGLCVSADVEIAFKYYLQAAELGDPQAQLTVGNLYLKGYDYLIGVPTDEFKQLFSIEPTTEVDEDTGAFIFVDERSKKRRLIEEMREKAKNRLSRPVGVSEPVAKETLRENKRKAITWIRKAAEAGVAKAQVMMARFYLEGQNGIENDIYKAREYLLQAAKQRNADALYNLGTMYFIGMQMKKDDKIQKIEKDVNKAIKYFTQAAELGDSSSQFWLGHAYHQGQIVEKDLQKALDYLNSAISQNHPGAIYYLALMYRTGDGIEQNEQKWEELFNKAVELEWPEALYCLADMYYHGSDGRTQDYKKALEYYERAGQKGSADALYCLAVMHYLGQGTEQDFAKAYKIYTQAATAGKKEALLAIASMLSAGEGVDKNEKEAKRLIDLYQSLQSDHNNK